MLSRSAYIKLTVVMVLAVAALVAAACGSAEEAAAPQKAAPAAPAAAAIAAPQAPAQAAAAAPAAAMQPAPAAAAAAAAAPQAPEAAAAARGAAPQVARTAPAAKPITKMDEVYVPPRQVAGAYGSVYYKGPRPTTFQENPRFAQMVKDGQLPPLEDRLPIPEDVLILDVVDEIGVYGGTWRRTQTSFWAPFVEMRTDCIFEDLDRFLFQGYICKGFETSEDGRTFTFKLRDGYKWSDGVPLDIEDVRFAWEDLNYMESVPGPHPQVFSAWRPNTYKDPITGNVVQFKVEDDLTFSMSFDSPHFGFIHGMIHTRTLRCNFRVCFYAPAHYVKPFHAKYADPAELTKLIKEGGHEDWVDLIKERMYYRRNYKWGAPYIGSHYVLKGDSHLNEDHTYTSNPYYGMADPMGNQLPYTDGMFAKVIESREVAIFRAMAGEHDFGVRNQTTVEIPMYVANMEKGDFSIYRYGSGSGYDGTRSLNQTYNQDPEIGMWMRTKAFREALSMTVDGDALNNLNWLGLGTRFGGVPPVGETPYAPGGDSELPVMFDIAKANSMLDALGLVDTDGDGLRNRTGVLGGGTGNLDLYMNISATGGFNTRAWADEAQILQEGMAEIGIRLDFKVNSDAGRLFSNSREYMSAGASGGRSIFNRGGPFPVSTSGGKAPAIGNYVGSRGDCTVAATPVDAECMAPTGPDSTWLPLASRGDTWAADSDGTWKAMQELWLEASEYPLDHPSNHKAGQEIWKLSAAARFDTPLICCAPDRMMLKRNNVRNVPKHAANYYNGNYHELYYFEGGVDNLNNPGNRSKKYKSESFTTGLTY